MMQVTTRTIDCSAFSATFRSRPIRLVVDYCSCYRLCSARISKKVEGEICIEIGYFANAHPLPKSLEILGRGGGKQVKLSKCRDEYRQWGWGQGRPQAYANTQVRTAENGEKKKAY